VVGEVRAYGLTAANVYGPSFGRHHLIRPYPYQRYGKPYSTAWLTGCRRMAIKSMVEPPEGSVLCRKCAGVEGRRR